MRYFQHICFSWRGRIGRLTYWIYSVPIVLIASLAYRGMAKDDEIAFFLIMLICFYIQTMINIKRAHDRNRRGLFVILLFIPIIDLWPLFEFWFLKGSEADNYYGPPDSTWSS